MVKSLKMKDKKLTVKKSHGLQYQEGTKMVPSSPFLTGARGITGVRGIEHPFEYEYIMMPSSEFHTLTKDDHILMSNIHMREACKKCKKSTCENCELKRK